MSQWIIGIKIAALGDGSLEHSGTLSDGRYRLASSLPEWDSHGIYRDVLASFPAEIGHRVDWSTGQVTVAGLDFDLLPTTEVLGWLVRTRFGRVADIVGELTASSTQLTATSFGLAGGTYTLGREAIYLHTHAGSGIYPTPARGVLGTTEYEHSVGFNNDVELFAMGESPIFNLPVELFRVRVDGGYADEETLWRGVIHSRSRNGDSGYLNIVCDSALDVLSRTTICKRLWRGSLDASATADSGYYRGQSGRQPVVNDADPGPYDLLLSDGTRAWVGAWNDNNTTNVGPGANTTYQPFGGGQALWSREAEGGSGLPGEIWQIHSTGSDAPSINVDDRGWSQNVYDLVLELLTTTGDGSNGDNDLGSAGSSDEVRRGLADLGGGIPVDLIDLQDIAAKKALNPRAVVDALNWPLDGKPLQLLPFIRDRILRPFGLALVPASGRRLAIRGIEDVDVEAVAVSDEDFVGRPDVTYDEVSAVDEVTIKFYDRPGIGPFIQPVSNGYRQERSVGATQVAVEIDAGGVKADPGSDGTSALVEALGADYVSRYAWPIPVVRLEAKRTLALDLGDVVEMTHRAITNVDGTKGINGARMVVSGVELSLETGSLFYTFWWTSAGYNRTGRIGPSVRLKSWTAMTSTGDTGPNDFLPDGTVATINNTEYTSDAGVFEGLIALNGGPLNGRLLNPDLSIKDPTLTVTAASGAADTITLAGLGVVTPVAGDIVVLDDYDTAGAVAKARYAFQADASPTLGAAGDTAYEWS